jgi:hypothetical protein
MIGTAWSTHGEQRNTHRIVLEKVEGKRSLGILKWILGMVLTALIWRALVNKVI